MLHSARIICSTLLLVLLTSMTPAFALDDAGLQKELSQLTSKSFSKKKAALEVISQSQHPKTIEIFNQLLAGELFYIKKTKEVVTANLNEGMYTTLNAVTGADTGEHKKRKVKKVSLNNKLRKTLRVILATLQLSHPDEEIRLQAAQQIMESASEEMLEPLKTAAQSETSEAVRDTIVRTISLIQLDDSDPAVRLAALKNLEGSLEPNVVARIKQLLEQDESGNFINESSAEVQATAKELLVDIEGEISLYKLVENLFFGVSLGSVLLLAAVGLAITFGVMGVINMAHGEMIMIGAYTTYVIQQIMPTYIGASLFIAIPMAFIISALIGILIERTIIRHLYGRPLETLLATFGLSLVLQQAVRSIFSPLNRSVITPDWMAGSWQVNGALSLTYNRLYIILFAIAVLIALMVILKRTRFGLQMRAVTQNRSMAKAMGIRTDWVDAMTFGLGSGIAGMAGVALSQLTNVGPNLGQAYIIDSFMVVVFGGVGNLFGTFFAAMSLGIANKFTEPFAGAVLAKILILVFIIIFIQRRPKGLFALKGRAAED